MITLNSRESNESISLSNKSTANLSISMILLQTKKFMLLAISIVSFSYSQAQTLYFPPATGNQWETIEPQSLGWCTENIEALYSYLENINSKAFIVLKDGKIVLEKYFGTFTQDSMWYWASAGKTLTSFMIGIAQQEGYLSIYDTTSQYLGNGWTSCTQQQEQKIKIRNQLTMTTGFDDGVPDNHCTLPSCLQCLADPGTRWAYHNAPYTLLEDVISEATGQSLNIYLYNKLSMVTGITGLYVQTGYDKVFFSKPRSMARFGLLVLNRGCWNNTQVMTDTSYFREMTTTSQLLNLSYGYLWWLNGKETFMVPGLQYVFQGSPAPSAPADMISGLGKNGQFLNVVPSQNLVTVRLGNAPDEGDVPFLYNDSIWQRLNDVICTTTPVENAQAADHHLRVDPNPADLKCRVEWPDEIFEIFISDYSGRVVLHKTGVRNLAEIDTQVLYSGLYIITLRNNSGNTMTRKLIIMH